MNLRFLIGLVLSTVISVSEARPQQSRIVNGELASDFQFPWHASIRAVRGAEPIRYFGGSLISQNFVLTVGRYINKADISQVTMGSTTYWKPSITIDSNVFFIHPNFNPISLIFDIGLIKLPYNVPYSNNVKPIRLPARTQQYNTFENANALVSGFGVTASRKNF